MNKASLKLRLFHFWLRCARPMTLGVRVLIQDDAGKILLVRHGYVSGWHLPGGGVEKGETAAQAAKKELLEETGLAALDEPELIAIYANQKVTGAIM